MGQLWRFARGDLRRAVEKAQTKLAFPLQWKGFLTLIKNSGDPRNARMLTAKILIGYPNTTAALTTKEAFMNKTINVY